MAGTDIDNQRQAEAQLREHASRLERLHAIAAALAPTRTPDQVLRAVIHEAIATLGAQASVAAVVGSAHDLLTVTHVRGDPAEADPAVERMSLDAPLPLADAIRQRRLLWYESRAAFIADYPHFADHWGSDEDFSLICVPFQVDDRALGSLALHFEPPRPVTEADVDFLQAIAYQCAQALDRALLYAAVAETTRAKDEALALLDTLFASAPVGLAFLDRDLRYVRVNETLAAIHGCSAADHIGRRLADVRPQLAPTIEPLYRAVLETGQPIINREIRGPAPTAPDEVHHWLDSYYPVATPGEPPIGLGVVVVDITEIKRVNAALGESEQKLATLVDILPVGISILNHQNRIVYANPALERILHLSRAQLLAGEYQGRRYLQSDGTPMASSAFASVRATAEQRLVQDVETGIVVGDGSVTWTNVSALPVTLADWGVVMVVSDITDRRRAEDALRASEERFRAIIENGSEGVVLVDADRRIRYVSPTVSVMLGYTADEIRALGPQAMTHPDDRPALEHLRAAIFATPGARGQITVRTQHRDGRWRWIDRTIVNQLHNPAISSVIVTFRDVTERVQAEQALRRSEERFAKAFYANPAAMIITRVSDGLIIDVNASYLRILEYTREEVIGSSGSVLAIHTDAAERRAVIERLRRDGFVHDYEATLRTKSGEFRHGLFSLETIELQGEQCILSIFYDISERKLAENALHASRQQLKDLSLRLVSAQEIERRALAYELHDEIGQQLTGLNMALEVSARASAEQLRAKLREAQRLVANLTSQVRQLSLDLRPPMIDDLGLLPTLLWHIQRYMQQTNLMVDFKHSGLDIALPPHVAIAAYRIVQEGLTNVARHAQAASATVRVWASAGQLKITIEDQGCGFDTSATLLAGRSVGLASMHERAELLGGQFNVDSTPGEGTRIRVTLPLDAATLE